MSDHAIFPNAVYKDSVLAPLFEGAKAHFVAPVRAINRAHLVMLSETKILSPADAGNIARALENIDNGPDIADFAYTGEFEDYFFFVEAQLKDQLGGDLAGALHTARSRNDMDHTIFKLVLREKLDTLLGLGHASAQAFIATAEREKSTLIVAYTHGQPAQPTTFGHYLGAAIEILLRDLERLHSTAELLQKCPMGAAAITTSGFPIDRHRMAELLGFAAPLQNSYSCIAGVDYVTGLYSAIKLLFLHLGRLVQDFQFWSSFEVGQLYVPDEFVQISSIMPQKRNPVPIEHLRLLSSLTIGRCDMVVNTMHNTPFTDMNDAEGEVQQSGYAAFASGGRMLALLGALVPALGIAPARVRTNMDKSCITITELADTLVRKEGLSFRQAHEIAALTAKEVLGENKPLETGYRAFFSAFETVTGRPPTLDNAAFEIAVSAENFVAVRTRFGGPAPAPLKAAIAGYRDDLQELRQKSAQRQALVSGAEQKLAAAFEGLKNNKQEEN